jgi:hypothetical protein
MATRGLYVMDPGSDSQARGRFASLKWLARLAVWVPLLAASSLLPSASAAAPRDEVLRLVPEDVGFCLIVQDLRDHADALAASPFVEQFAQTPLGAAIGSAKETEKLKALEKEFQKALGIDWTRLRDDVLGDAVVLAYRPGPPGQPKQDQDLVLIRARDAKLLAELIDRLNQVQKDRKEVKELEERRYKGQTYFRRVESEKENFYFLHGPVLAVSSREEMLHAAIDRDGLAGDEESPVARQLRLLGADGRLAALWINPRAFDADMAQRAAAAKGAEAAARQAFLPYWKSVDGIALSADLQKDFELVLAVRSRTDALPAAAKRLFSTAARPSELWDRFPDNALLATAGRVDPAAFLDVLGDFLTTEDRDVLLTKLQGSLGAVLDSRDVKEVVPYLGPDWGLCITAPPAGGKEWFPHVLVALRVQPGGKPPPVDQALLSAVDSLATWLRIGYNLQHKDQIVARTVTQDKVEIKYLVSAQCFPPGVSPAYALRDGYLVLASSPELIRGFGPAVGSSPSTSDEFPLLRMSLKDLRQYVQDRREPLAAAVAEKNQLPREEADRRLSNLLIGLQILDRLEIRQRTAPGQVTLTLRVKTSKPLRK